MTEESNIEKRKMEHIKISLKNDVSSGSNSFDDVQFVYNCLPEINFDDIDTSIEFFGKKLDVPVLISSMTGGTQEAKKINQNLDVLTSLDEKINNDESS